MAKKKPAPKRKHEKLPQPPAAHAHVAIAGRGSVEIAGTVGHVHDALHVLGIYLHEL
jgi:hypothetical protein